jgi:hypothetical protein
MSGTEDVFSQVVESRSPACFNMNQCNCEKVYMMSGLCLRCTIPLGMNRCAPFIVHPRTTGSAGPVIQEVGIIPAAETTIEEETRRNVFWLCA